MALVKQIDLEKAAGLIRAGATVRDVASTFNVSTQAVYLHIRKGALPKPLNSKEGTA